MFRSILVGTNSSELFRGGEWHRPALVQEENGGRKVKVYHFKM